VGQITCDDGAADADNVRKRFRMPAKSNGRKYQPRKTYADDPDLENSYNIDEDKAPELLADRSG